TLLYFPLQHTPYTEMYTLSLHDALPISIYGYTERGSLVNSSLNFDQEYPLYYNPSIKRRISTGHSITNTADRFLSYYINASYSRSEEHTSELQSRENLVCRLLLEKKN